MTGRAPVMVEGDVWDRPDLAERGVTPTGEFRVTHALRPDAPTDPEAYLVRSFSPAATVGSHFHEHPQFQVFVEGGGTFQRRDIEVVTVHFTDAYSVYGPIVAGDRGLSFYVLRPCHGEGAHYMPGSREQLVRRGRRNLHHTVAAEHLAGGEATLFADDDGLLCAVARVAPGDALALPGAAPGQDCYTLVLEGTVTADDETLGPRSVIHRRPDGDEPAPLLTGGSNGAVVVSMRFPVPEAQEATAG